MRSKRVIWTIGHSNHTFERFVELLRIERIEFVVDVRSHPYSRFAEQFNRERLEVALHGADMRYVFMGDELGGRPSREDHYDEQGRALYDRMAEQGAFQSALQRLLRGCREHRVALMCSEAEPRNCHRRLLVGKVLAEQGVRLRHILTDGAILIEDVVTLGDEDAQESLFAKETVWRSTQSVSHRRLPSISSAA